MLWRHNKSPWKDRIELHGNRVDGHVSNAAFIRSLMASFVRRWGADHRIGGLFGSIDRDGNEKVLPWKRSQQAAFLISCWTHIHTTVKSSKSEWATALKEEGGRTQELFSENEFLKNTAFSGPNTLLATDQGCRAVFLVYNAMCQIAYSEIELETWESDEVSDKPNDEDVSVALEEFQQFNKAGKFLGEIADALINLGMDWRTSSSKTLSESESKTQAAYRGSSGYSLLQKECFKYLEKSSSELVSETAKSAARMLGIQ